MTVINLPRKMFYQKYLEVGGKKPAWYVKYILRAFTDMTDIYVNEGGIFLFSFLSTKDYELVITHERGHLEGKEHTLFGVMSPYGLIRLLTSYQYVNKGGQ